MDLGYSVCQPPSDSTGGRPEFSYITMLSTVPMYYGIVPTPGFPTVKVRPIDFA
ncbi:MAG: hypothetical protein ACREBI_12090 [Nitrosotalea sp.]